MGVLSYEKFFWAGLLSYSHSHFHCHNTVAILDSLVMIVQSFPWIFKNIQLSMWQYIRIPDSSIFYGTGELEYQFFCNSYTFPFRTLNHHKNLNLYTHPFLHIHYSIRVQGFKSRKIIRKMYELPRYSKFAMTCIII